MSRPAGATNQRSIAIKQMLEKALTKAGGVDYFVEQSKENPVAFMGLIGKIIPTRVSSTINIGIFDKYVLSNETGEVIEHSPNGE